MIILGADQLLSTKRELEVDTKLLMEETFKGRRDWVAQQNGPTITAILNKYPLFGICHDAVSVILH